VKVTSFNGRAELYASTKYNFPSVTNAEFSANSLSGVAFFTYDVTGVDLSTKPLYIGVLGGSMTTYMLYIDSTFTQLYP
jgi:hypothetical protein